MGIKVIWDNDEKTIIRYCYDSQWTLSDFNEAYTESRALLNTVDHKVHFIIDIRDSHILPNGALSRGRTITNSPHPNEGRTAIVGANAVIRAVMNLFRRIYGAKFEESKFIFVDSLENARQELNNATPAV